MKSSGFILLLMFTAVNLFSQNMPEARNSFYLSFGFIPFGPISAGLNYERMISPNACIKVGVNISEIFSPTPDFPDETYLSFPVSIHYLTSNNNKFEVGLGGGPVIRISGSEEKFFPIAPSISIGYRYQLERSSMFYRMGVDIPSAPAINLYGIGYHF